MNDIAAREATSASAEPQHCAWCGSSLTEKGRKLAGRTKCGSCGAATTSPWPTEAQIEAAYGDWYRPEGGRRFGFLGDAILTRTRASLALRVDRIAPPGQVLDVGAGDGTLVAALRARGRGASGLERGSADPDLLETPIEDLGGDWAAVVFWHSLEHLPEPGAAIREATRLLIPGGVVVVAVPDNDSLQARVFGDRWLHLDMPRHLCHLTTAALESGLAENGFEVRRISRTRGGQIVIGWLDGMVGTLPGLSLYQSLRRRNAVSTPIPASRRLVSILAGVLLLPLAAIASIVEISARRSGTVYVEATRV